MAESKMTLYLEESLAKRIDKETKINMRSKNNMINFILHDYFAKKGDEGNANENKTNTNKDCKTK